MPTRPLTLARNLALAVAVVGGLVLMHGLTVASGHGQHDMESANSGMLESSLGPVAHVTEGSSEHPDAPPVVPTSHLVALCLAIVASVAGAVLARWGIAIARRPRASNGRSRPTARAPELTARGSPLALLCVQRC
jgi:hypothetical protein